MTATKQVIDFSNAEISDHVEYLFGGLRGHVSVELFNRAAGTWSRGLYEWPQSKAKIVRHCADAPDGVEVYVCPYVMKARQRAAGNASSLRTVHVDADKGLPEDLRDTLTAWGFRLVASGTPGHVQIFGRLSRSLTAAEHRGVEVALRRKVNGDNKIADNDLMRVPGTRNWKPGNDGTQVEVIAPGRNRIDANDLIDWLDVSPVFATVTKRAPVKAVPVPGGLTANIKRYMHEESNGDGSGRYLRCYKAVCDTAEAGYDRDQIHAILADFGPGVDKWNDDWPRQLDAIYDKWETTQGQSVEAWNADDHFWNGRKTLRHIKLYAYASTANAWATLAVVLARVLHTIPPDVLLPGHNGGTTGSRAVNLFVAMIGDSGAGKKTATDAARDAFIMEAVDTLPIGTGEGVVKAFIRKGDPKKNEPDWVEKTRKVMFDVPEVSMWDSLKGRTGTSIDAVLLSAFSGEALGFTNADDTKTTFLAANSYRLGLIVGVQPGASAKLFSDDVRGLPQRFLYMPTAVSKDDYDLTKPLVPPASREWFAPEFHGPHTIDYPDEAKLEIREARFGATGMDSQAIVIKMKVAAALAFLEGHTDVTDEDWALAGVVVTKSRHTRDAVMSHLRDRAKAANVAQGKAAAVRQLAAQSAVERHDIDRTKERVLTVLRKQAGGWVRQLPSAVGGPYKAHLAKAVTELSRDGVIERRTFVYRGQEGTEWRVKV